MSSKTREAKARQAYRRELRSAFSEQMTLLKRATKPRPRWLVLPFMLVGCGLLAFFLPRTAWNLALAIFIRRDVDVEVGRPRQQLDPSRAE